MLFDCLRQTKDGIELRLICAPSSRRVGIHNVVEDGHGGKALKISVSAPPEDGKANKSVIELLAKAWKLPKSRISILRGEAQKHKTILLSGEAPELMKKLGDWWRDE